MFCNISPQMSLKIANTRQKVKINDFVISIVVSTDYCCLIMMLVIWSQWAEINFEGSLIFYSFSRDFGDIDDIKIKHKLRKVDTIS